MKAQLLAGKDMIIGELIWPDDLSDADITDTALKALGNYYKAIGSRLVPRPQYKVVPMRLGFSPAAGKRSAAGAS